MGKSGRARGIMLLICAAPKQGACGWVQSLLVCGLPPGHAGKHRDIEWPVWW